MIVFPNLEENSIIEWAYRLYSPVEYLGGRWRIQEYDLPIVHSEYELKFPDLLVISL